MDTKKFFQQYYNSKELTEADCSANYMDLFSIDSIGLIILIGDLENQFGIRFTDDDFKSENFKTIQGIDEIIKRKKAG